MMLLIGLAITVAFVASWGASLGLLDHELDFWWELALLIVIMLLGHWIEMRSLAQTTSALDSLAALLPDEAELVEGETIVTVAARQTCGWETWSSSARAEAFPRMASRRRARRNRRVDGHRRITDGAPRHRCRSSPAPSPPTPGCGSR